VAFEEHRTETKKLPGTSHEWSDAVLVDALSEALIVEIDAAMIGWLDEVSRALGKERHADTEEIGRNLAKALGTMTSEEYSAA
jgi:hypothetical protein